MRLQQYTFCPGCAGRLHWRQVQPGEPPRLVCEACGQVLYLDPRLAVIGVVPYQQGVVLLRQRTGRHLDRWALPGGCVDRGETLETALVREIWEETGLWVRVVRLLQAYSYPGQKTVVLAYLTHYLRGELTPGRETEEVRVFPPEEIPWDHLAFRTTEEVLQAYLATLPGLAPLSRLPLQGANRGRA